ncbi:Nif3-like dinuclear metal center hexameric protein [Rubritalea marina]|uniref:Nif3-like dinuclear metal center hexameric protein n=1 Tax=Rubritalea marina TaxID=361055 RepID=UPI00035F38A4|nr:Nif3-like dinuclear metal center hexameric protein [Rubritalea marina]
MARLTEIVEYLDVELDLAEVPDYPAAHNGLQLQNRGEVTKVAAAVDASLPVIRKAIDEGADLLVVHHGLFWQGVQKLVGAPYQKFAEAIEAGLAIYSAHIPLDRHPEYGNNALMAEAIGMDNWEAYHPWKGTLLGVRQSMDISLDDLQQRVSTAVGGAVHVCPGRQSGTVGMVGLVTGGAGSEIESMAAQGIDTFITGEGQHWTYPLAEELGVNMLYAGHYQTETFGVKKLASLIGDKWAIESCFIDHPTGL